MDHEQLWTAGILTVLALFVFFSYRYEFAIKLWWRGRQCSKSGHDWVIVYRYTQQCRHCHKVSDLSKEAWTR